MSKPYDETDAARINQEWVDTIARLSDDDQKLMAVYRLLGQLVDPRYEAKGIRLLVARALVDPTFRSHVLTDADATVADLRGYVELPEGTRIRCVENTTQELTIVLPPPSRELPERSRTIRDSIYSRTTPEIVAAAGVDDNDLAPLYFPDIATGDHDYLHFGDYSHDG